MRTPVVRVRCRPRVGLLGLMVAADTSVFTVLPGANGVMILFL